MTQTCSIKGDSERIDMNNSSYDITSGTRHHVGSKSSDNILRATRDIAVEHVWPAECWRRKASCTASQHTTNIHCVVVHQTRHWYVGWRSCNVNIISFNSNQINIRQWVANYNCCIFMARPAEHQPCCQTSLRGLWGSSVVLQQNSSSDALTWRPQLTSASSQSRATWAIKLPTLQDQPLILVNQITEFNTNSTSISKLCFTSNKRSDCMTRLADGYEMPFYYNINTSQLHEVTQSSLDKLCDYDDFQGFRNAWKM